MTVELVTEGAAPQPLPTGPVAPLVEQARALVLSDKATFDAAIEQIKARINAEIGPFVEEAKNLKVTDKQTAEDALCVGKKATAFIRRITDLLDPLKQDFHRPWKQASALINALTGDLEQIKDSLSKQVTKFTREEKERERKEAEAAAQARIDAAKTLVDAGKPAAAREMISRPLEVPTAEKPKVDGTTLKENWTWQLTGDTEREQAASFVLLIAAVASGRVPVDALDVNRAWLTAQAKHQKGAMKYPGVTVYDAGSVAYGRD